MTNSPEVVEVERREAQIPDAVLPQPRESVVRGFFNDNADLFGMNPQQVARLRSTPNTPIRTVLHG